MANKQKLQDLLKQRTTPPQREAVKPVNLYTSPQVDKPTQEQDNKSIQVNKTTKPQTVKPVSKQVVKTVKPQADKQVKPLVVKYTTHLKPEVIKAIKLLAVETDKKDYELVGEAVESYLLKVKKS
jgi:hypothetical protein